MQFQPVAPVRAYERIVEQIEEAVVSGRLKPGERLPGERELMVQFGVGRSTVREALRVLQASEIIRSRPGDPRGPEILAASPAALHRSMQRLARAEHVGLAELLQFRMILDGSAHLLAAALRTDADLADLDTAFGAMRALIPVAMMEALAARTDVRFVEPAAEAMTAVIHMKRFPVAGPVPGRQAKGAHRAQPVHPGAASPRRSMLAALWPCTRPSSASSRSRSRSRPIHATSS